METRGDSAKTGLRYVKTVVHKVFPDPEDVSLEAVVTLIHAVVLPSRVSELRRVPHDLLRR